MNSELTDSNYGKYFVYCFNALNSINNELYQRGHHNLNHYLLDMSSLLSKDLLIPKDKLFDVIIEEVSKSLINYSENYRLICNDPKYYSVLQFINIYMEEMLDYYDNLMKKNQEKFDRYISLESKMPSDKILKAQDLYMSIEDIQNTMNLLNEAVRKYYEIYNNKILSAEFTDEQIIKFKIKESQLAHLLGLNLYKIVNDSRYVDLFKITEDEIRGVLDKNFDPLGSASLSILHKIVDISNGNLLSFEEDRLKKMMKYEYKYVDYSDRRSALQIYSKINFKSKAFINFSPLEHLSLILNLPEGYELINMRKRRVEKGEVLPAQHSLLLSKNYLSEKYKYSSLITNYDKIQARRYFMSLFLKTPAELEEIQKVATPAITTKVMIGADDEDGGTGNAGGIVREFTKEEQGRFIEEIQTDFRHLNLTEVVDYFKKLGGNKKGM